MRGLRVWWGRRVGGPVLVAADADAGAVAGLGAYGSVGPVGRAALAALVGLARLVARWVD
ncbi:hypothetical protein AAHZ94_02740 [Streptomyces sp. HSW2009]|uniref:hypothetical protein n=1 Tax=Streptomyces sp. HSW2009 TaxID=3142890 RepID=UPI0032EC4CEB